MKKLLAILIAFSMLWQVIQVLHFFSAKAEIVYLLIDEETPCEKSKEVKENKADEKSLFFGQADPMVDLRVAIYFMQLDLHIPPPPHIEMPLLPPNFC